MFWKKKDTHNILAYLCFEFNEDLLESDIQVIESAIESKLLRRINNYKNICICEISGYELEKKDIETLILLIDNSHKLVNVNSRINAFGFAYSNIPKTPQDAAKIKDKATKSISSPELVSEQENLLKGLIITSPT